jgi:hypothetical protein
MRTIEMVRTNRRRVRSFHPKGSATAPPELPVQHASKH